MSEVYSILCEGCQSQLEIDAEYYAEIVGQVIECPDCEHEILVPALEEEPAAMPVTAPACISCGTALAPEAVFCVNCGIHQHTGQSMQAADDPTAPVNVFTSPPVPAMVQAQQETAPQKPKWILPATIGGGVAAVAVVILIVVMFGDDNPARPARPAQSAVERSPSLSAKTPSSKRRKPAALNAWMNKKVNYVPSNMSAGPWSIPVGHRLLDSWVTPDGNHLFYSCRTPENKRILYCNGTEVKTGAPKPPTNILMSSDCSHLAYVVGAGQKDMLVIDGIDQQIPELTTVLQFSPSGKHFSCWLWFPRTQKGRKAFILDGEIIDTTEAGNEWTFAGPDEILVSGNVVGYGDEKYKRCYIGSKWYDQVQTRNDESRFDIYSDHHVVVGKDAKGRHFLVVDGRESALFDKVGKGGFLGSQRVYCCQVEKDGLKALVAAGIQSPFYEKIPVSLYTSVKNRSIVLSKDGKHFAFCGLRELRQYLAHDSNETPCPEGYVFYKDGIAISPDGKHSAALLAVNKASGIGWATSVMLDGQLIPIKVRGKIEHMSFVGNPAKVAYRVKNSIQRRSVWLLNVGGEIAGECPVACYLPDGSCAYFVIGKDGKHSIQTADARIPFTCDITNLERIDALVTDENHQHYALIASIKKDGRYSKCLVIPSGLVTLGNYSRWDKIVISPDGNRIAFENHGRWFIDNMDSTSDPATKGWRSVRHEKPVFSSDSKLACMVLVKDKKKMTWLNDKWSESYDKMLSTLIVSGGGITQYVLKGSEVHRLRCE